VTDQERDQGIPKLVTELFEMVVAYAKQETIEPLKRLGKFVAWGLAGGMLTSLGIVVLLAGVLRLLQNETGSTFRGDMSPLPYAITLAAGMMVLGWAARSVLSGGRKARG
jgi:hypothetical protein